MINIMETEVFKENKLIKVKDCLSICYGLKCNWVFF